MPRSAPRRALPAPTLVVGLTVGAVISGCGAGERITADTTVGTTGTTAGSTAGSTAGTTTGVAVSTGASTSGSASASTSAPTGTSGAADPPTTSAAVPLTIAVAGDTQAYGVAQAIDTQGLGATGRLLAAADVSMVNVETAVVDDQSGLVKQPKQFNFVTSPKILSVLKDTGVDVVTVANNHGMDYGQEGLRRELLVKQRGIIPMVGIGHDATEAWAPWTTQVRGRRVVVFGASDVLDSTLDWTATDTKAGMAYIETDAGLQRLAAGVKAARAADPNAVILVYLHWGSERVRCPKPRQVQLATALSQAGASVVVGSHAHIQQPTGVIGSTAIDYGLGNFVFGSGVGTQRHTGVLTIQVPASGTPTMAWTPALIEGGLPRLLSGTAKQDALTEFQNLDGGCSNS